LFLGYIGQRFEPHLLNIWFSVRGHLSSPAEIVIVAIDEQSYSKLGLSFLEPLPRLKFVKLLERLEGYGVKAVLFDSVFNSPGPDRGVDELLAKKFSELPTYIGEYELDRSRSGAEPAERSAVRSLELFVNSARGTVNLNCPLDFGVWRRFPLVVENGAVVPALTKIVRETSGGGAELPGPRDFINFYGPAGVIQTIQFAEVLTTASEDALSKQFKDKIVVVGTKILADVGFSRKDTFLTPASNKSIFGVEVHATILANLLRSEWIRRLDVRVETTILNLILLFVVASTFSARPKSALAVIVVSIAAIATGSYLAFMGNIFFPGLMLMAIVLPLLLLFTIARYYLSLRRTHQDMADAFGVAAPANERMNRPTAPRS
jgi:CHASE2 domain-containing sensor protein